MVTTSSYDISKSPNAASRIYDLDGNTAPKKKSLFFVRFRKTDAGQAGSEWQKNIGFFVKSLDRPSVQAQLEELNQYNKKRQITTGFKLQPMNIEFYDTQDGAAMQMWDEYSRYYYGDFNQEDDSQFRYDITTQEMLDNGAGYGYVPRKGNSVPDDLNSGYFFDSLEVYQVFGNYYTQFDLVNPKIETFDPDELTYETHEISTIKVVIRYEAIIHRNSGKPISIEDATDAEFIRTVFENQFRPNTVDYYEETSPRKILNYTKEQKIISKSIQAFNLIKDLSNNVKNGYYERQVQVNGVFATGKGILRTFGNYGFGTTATTGVKSGDISYVANDKLASILNLSPNTSVTNNTAQKLSTISRPQSISDSIVTSALDSFGSTTGSNAFAKQYAKDTLISGVILASTAESNSAKDHVLKTNDGKIELSDLAIGAVNATRPTTSRIGFNNGK